MSRLPVDRDWAWVVAFGAAINLFLACGSYSIYGMIFVEIQKMYDVTSAMSSTMFCVYNAANALTVLAQAMMTGKLTDRVLCIVAGVTFALAFGLQFVAPNVLFFVITFGIFAGVGSTFAMYCGLVTLGYYFDKKLSIATGLAFLGASSGQFIIPQILKGLLEAYGLKGAMLVLGAVHLHPIVSAMLFRPVEFYKGKSPKQVLQSQISNSGKSHCDTSMDIIDKKFTNGHLDSTNIDDVEMVPLPNQKNYSMKEAFRYLCTSKRFYLFVAGRSLCVVANNLLILFIPPLAASKGCSLSEVSLLLTVMGAVDLPSRPFHGWLVSLKSVDVTYYIGVTSIVCSGIVFACTFIPSSSVALLYIMGISLTVLFNPNVCLMNVITIESVGRELFPRAMMLNMMVTYTFLTFLPTLFGRLFDVLGSYTVPMSICAVCGVVGGCLTILEKRFRPEPVLDT